MEIAIHLGAHCTDGDLIVQTLRRNGTMMAERSLAIPPHRTFRPALRRALRAVGEDPLAEAAASHVSFLDEIEERRVILSYEAFLAANDDVLLGSAIYPEAGIRCGRLQDLFGGHDVSFLMALRNPATFIPALYEASSEETFATFLAGSDLAGLRWSHTVAAIRKACPNVPMTLWCNEDLPLIWPDVLCAVAGVAPGSVPALDGSDAVLHRVMTPEGLARLKNYLVGRPPDGPASRRRIVSAFLAKYADEAAVAPEIALEGWTEDVIAGLSAIYESDVARIAARADLRFIAS